MSNQEMTNLLKTTGGRIELRQYLVGKMEEGLSLNNTELIFLVALNNIEADNGN